MLKMDEPDQLRRRCSDGSDGALGQPGVRFGARQKGVSSRIDGPCSGQALAHLCSAWAEECTSGRQQQKHAGGAPAVPNRRGEDEAQRLDTRGSSPGEEEEEEEEAACSLGSRGLERALLLWATTSNYWQSTARAEE